MEEFTNQQQNSQQNEHAQAPMAQPLPKKIGKFKASKKLASASYHLLKKDKEILLFPIISALLNLLVLGAFALFFMFGPLDLLVEDEAVSLSSQDYQVYATVFVYYVITYFLVTFFQVGLTAVVYERIKGGDFSFGDGIGASMRIIFKIFLWALIASTVGILIRIVFEKSKFLGKIVIWILGTAWNVLTFFIIPVLLLDNVSLWQSIKNSGNIFKRTWGETLILNISLGFFFGFLAFLAIVIYIGLLVLIAVVASFTLPIFILITALLFLVLVALSILSASFNSIFRVVLYEYSKTGNVIEGFPPELVIGAIKKN